MKLKIVKVIKNILIGLLLSILFSACKCEHITKLDQLSIDEYKNFVRESCTQSYSPIAYSVLVGENPANDYDWSTVYITQSWWRNSGHQVIFEGNDSDLVKMLYPNADTIMYYNGTYSIGYKRDKNKDIKP
jgi:hypothetical protein